jgi:phospholipase A-2-activating protein
LIQVKGVSFPSPKAIISASRDGTVRLWKLLSDSPPLYDSTISSNSPAFVNAVAYLPPSSQFVEGLIISGGKEAIIDVRQPSKAPDKSADALLLGHSSNVCSLDVDQEGKFIVSGSWDNDARIWPVGKWESEVVLKGHDHAPWAVLAYSSDTIITGSGDNHIRVFNRSGKLIKKFLGSDGPVRSLCRLPKDHPSRGDFASAANDGVIRFWSLGGQRLGELHGHDSFVYSIAALPSGELVSSGEDRTVRVWRGNQCVQTITHPAISVWQVAVCTETGDIVTGASDKIVRVFTRNSERFADAETTKQFEDSVKESSIPQQQVGEINKEKLPGPEFLTSKAGTKDGQVQTIREMDGSVTAHTWSSSELHSSPG